MGSLGGSGRWSGVRLAASPLGRGIGAWVAMCKTPPWMWGGVSWGVLQAVALGVHGFQLEDCSRC
jgi:hypothetical protein